MPTEAPTFDQLDREIIATRRRIARLLRARLTANLTPAYPDLRALWVSEPDSSDQVRVVRALGPGGTILWDHERDHDQAFHGFHRTETGLWFATDDLRILIDVLPADTPRTRDGYVIVKLGARRPAAAGPATASGAPR